MKENRTHLLYASLAVLLIVGSSCSFRGAPSEKDKAKYREACAPIIAWLNEQKVEHQKYPDTLPSHYQKVLNDFPYPSRYYLHATNSWFGIQIGDYSFPSLFEYHYDSRYNQWFMDD